MSDLDKLYSGETLISITVRLGYLEIMKKLKERKAQVNLILNKYTLSHLDSKK
jgi:hypothetical protein